MLHGYTQNASIFSKRLAAIRKICQGKIDMVFVDAPHVIQLPTSTGEDLNKFDSMASSLDESDPTSIPRAWWIMKEVVGESNQIRHIFQGFDESIKSLRKVIDEQGPFDACFGFSQGAALAGILSSILEHPPLHPAFSEPPLTEQKPLKAVILVSGFKPAGLLHMWRKDDQDSDIKLVTRSLHVVGRTDLIIGEERTNSLIQVYSDPRVEWHDGGHFVPSKKNWRDFFLLYFQTMGQDNGDQMVPSPTYTSEDLKNRSNT